MVSSPSPRLKLWRGGAKVLLRCNFRGKGDRQGHMDQRNQLKNKNKTKKPKYMEAKALQTI